MVGILQKYSGKSIQGNEQEREPGDLAIRNLERFSLNGQGCFRGGGWRGCGGDRHYLLRHGIPGVMREDVAIAPLPGSISFRLSKPSSHPLPPSGWQG